MDYFITIELSFKKVIQNVKNLSTDVTSMCFLKCLVYNFVIDQQLTNTVVIMRVRADKGLREKAPNKIV